MDKGRDRDRSSDLRRLVISDCIDWIEVWSAFTVVDVPSSLVVCC